jgi:hypothetical protein
MKYPGEMIFTKNIGSAGPVPSPGTYFNRRLPAGLYGMKKTGFGGRQSPFEVCSSTGADQ